MISRNSKIENNLRSHAPLTAGEEANLMRIVANYELPEAERAEAKHSLILCNLDWVWSYARLAVVRRHQSSGITHQVEDLVQEILLKIYQSMDNLKPDEFLGGSGEPVRFATYVRRIAQTAVTRYFLLFDGDFRVTGEFKNTWRVAFELGTKDPYEVAFQKWQVKYGVDFDQAEQRVFVDFLRLNTYMTTYYSEGMLNSYLRMKGSPEMLFSFDSKTIALFEYALDLRESVNQIIKKYCIPKSLFNSLSLFVFNTRMVMSTPIAVDPQVVNNAYYTTLAPVGWDVVGDGALSIEAIKAALSEPDHLDKQLYEILVDFVIYEESLETMATKYRISRSGVFARYQKAIKIIRDKMSTTEV
ncbi:MAG: hypothetical protein JNK26_00650 [Candidatus Doudnabacteria bacterium]|nr:hypothetical protein [Candidatus Doudnabacteria bacterium]